MRRVAGLFLALVASGCMSTTLQTARTNGEGNFQVAAETGVTGCAGCGFGFNLVDGAPAESFWFPGFGVSFRYGISDRVDLGARLHTFSGYELQSKFMLTNPSKPGTALSLAPSITLFGGGFANAGAVYIDARVPLLIGVPVGEHELVIGPRARPILLAGGATGEGGAIGVLFAAGAQVGFAARIADIFWIVPEIGAEYFLVGAGTTTDGNGGGATGTPFDGVFWSAGLGFMYGGRPSETATPPSAPPSAAPTAPM